MSKVVIALILLIVIIWAVVMTYVVFWLFRNFQEYREISKYNDNTFKDVLSAHSSEIGSIKESIKNTSEDLDKVISDITETNKKQAVDIENIKSSLSTNSMVSSEYQKELIETNKILTEHSYKLSSLETVINFLNGKKK